MRPRQTRRTWCEICWREPEVEFRRRRTRGNQHIWNGDFGAKMQGFRELASAACFKLTSLRKIRRGSGDKAHAFEADDLLEWKDSRNPRQDRGASQAVP